MLFSLYKNPLWFLFTQAGCSSPTTLISNLWTSLEPIGQIPAEIWFVLCFKNMLKESQSEERHLSKIWIKPPVKYDNVIYSSNSGKTLQGNNNLFHLRLDFLDPREILVLWRSGNFMATTSRSVSYSIVEKADLENCSDLMKAKRRKEAKEWPGCSPVENIFEHLLGLNGCHVTLRRCEAVSSQPPVLNLRSSVLSPRSSILGSNNT